MTAGSWGQLPIPGADRTLAQDWRFQPLPQARDESDSFLPYGSGRSYGDSCLNSHASALDTSRLARFITFDEQQGLLTCESGVTLNEILQVIVPRGWFLPVVPGTRFITLGGAIANDVHGKNHHRVGSFGCHVTSIGLLRSDGERLLLNAQDESGLFTATIGGLGLTGLITHATIKLVPIASDQMEVEDQPFTSLAEFLALSAAAQDWDYTVAWFDTFKRAGAQLRGIFSRGRHAASPAVLDPGPDSPRVSVPLAPPLSLVNGLSVDLFNRAYYQAGIRKKSQRRQHFQPFLFPLDAIAHWNRIYGRRGFYQYQCVVPVQGSEQSIGRLLELMLASREASFLAVLKAFGDITSPGLLSFPRPGLTLALDFPNRGDKTLRLMESFDEVVRECSGALYPAKDARMSAEMFALSYPRLSEFMPHIDPAFSSTFWRRVSQ